MVIIMSWLKGDHSTRCLPHSGHLPTVLRPMKSDLHELHVTPRSERGREPARRGGVPGPPLCLCPASLLLSFPDQGFLNKEFLLQILTLTAHLTPVPYVPSLSSSSFSLDLASPPDDPCACQLCPGPVPCVPLSQL